MKKANCCTDKTNNRRGPKKSWNKPNAGLSVL